VEPIEPRKKGPIVGNASHALLEIKCIFNPRVRGSCLKFESLEEIGFPGGARG
jgi:hypothetical protein